MRGNRSKYSADFNSEMKTILSCVLLDNPREMNIDEMKAADMRLIGLTTQKAARLLNEMVEMGFCVKSKQRSTNRVCYKAVGTMIDEGYEIGPDRGYDYSDKIDEYIARKAEVVSHG